MAKQTINLGSAANDGTGDKLRVAFDKINDNFDELYAQGDKGAKGEVGVQGAQGVQGATGAGAQGAQGQKGEPGEGGGGGSGAQGAQGAQGVQGAIGAQGVQGTNGVDGAQGAQGHQGVQGAIGTQGVQGAIGSGTQGEQGVQGSAGSKGDKGDIGAQGLSGDFSGASFTYIYSENTANTDPGTGFLKFNNHDNLALATELYIDDADHDGTDIQNFIRTIDDSTSTIKGHFRVSLGSNLAAFALFTISSLHENDGYYTVGSSYVSGSAAGFEGNDNVTITFARTGDRGDKGSIGAQGVQGTLGAQGEQGFQGVQGATGSGAQGVQGEQGAQGFQGIQGATGSGAQGEQGSQGHQGVQGATGSGAQGEQGYQGYQGVQGEIGTLGEQGAQGVQGDIGAQGAQGVQGSIGTGAYDQTLNTNSVVVFAGVATDTLNVKQVYETTNALSSATGTVTHNCALGHVFVHSSVSANFTANFTNLTVSPNNAVALTLVINQGGTPYIANVVQIGGQAQTVNWLGSSTAPAGNANKKDVMAFSIVNNNGTYITLGQLSSFG